MSDIDPKRLAANLLEVVLKEGDARLAGAMELIEKLGNDKRLAAVERKVLLGVPDAITDTFVLMSTNAVDATCSICSAVKRIKNNFLERVPDVR